jgi:DNA polymerase-3 subunit gamma/tau
MKLHNFTAMEQFVVSARKYRPRKFVEVVGQQGVTTTLKNAIRSGHIAQSFLFCGPRGVGKTTCARILAKTINCENVGADFEACGQCHSCKSFEQSSSFNIHELDAASNNSVEDIRELVAQVRIPPQAGKYKVYIIDEVHMLSQAAFNAFLKTLEEPPAYAVFILATTEKHKIIPTILSRCQIYEFSRITVNDTVEHLKLICAAENITADNNALHIISQKADGALRDALSMFDRLVDPLENKLTLDSVLTNLNILDYDYYFRFTDYMMTSDTGSVMMLFDDVLRKGFEGDLLLSGLCEHFRNLLVCKDTKTANLLEASGDLRQRYMTQASLAPASFLLNGMSLANQCELGYKTSKNTRLHVELGLLKMTLLQNVINLAKTASPSAEVKKNSDSEQPSVVSHQSSVKPSSFSPVVEKKTVEPVTAPAVSKPVAEKPEPVAAATAVAEPQPQIEKPKKVLRIEGSTSLSELQNKATAKEKEAVAEGLFVAKQEIADDVLKECWETYAAKVTAEKPHITSLFRSNQPFTVDGAIKVIVNTLVQKNMFDEELPLFVQYVKNEKDLSIHVIVEVNKEPDAAPKKAYTQKEKLEMMIQKNPHVLTLMQKLDLK